MDAGTRRSGASADRALAIGGTASLDVTAAHYVDGYRIELRFRDGSPGIVDVGLITIESAVWNTLASRGIAPSEQMAGRMVLRGGQPILSTLRASRGGDRLVVSHDLPDESHLRNPVRLKHWSENQNLVLLNVSTFSAIYEKNRAHYDAVLSSVRK